MNDWKMAFTIWSIGGLFVILLNDIANIVFVMGKKENSKFNFLGFAILHKKSEYFYLQISDGMIKRAETIEYKIILRKKFVRQNYMDELIAKIGEKKISLRIDYYVNFIVR